MVTSATVQPLVGQALAEAVQQLGLAGLAALGVAVDERLDLLGLLVLHGVVDLVAQEVLPYAGHIVKPRYR